MKGCFSRACANRGLFAKTAHHKDQEGNYCYTDIVNLNIEKHTLKLDQDWRLSSHALSANLSIGLPKILPANPLKSRIEPK